MLNVESYWIWTSYGKQFWSMLYRRKCCWKVHLHWCVVGSFHESQIMKRATPLMWLQFRQDLWLSEMFPLENHAILKKLENLYMLLFCCGLIFVKKYSFSILQFLSIMNVCLSVYLYSLNYLVSSEIRSHCMMCCI